MQEEFVKTIFIFVAFVALQDYAKRLYAQRKVRRQLKAVLGNSYQLSTRLQASTALVFMVAGALLTARQNLAS